MYDVIIAGAGPAGSTAAKRLADAGLSVLLAEKLAVPRYKSCSGVLIRKSLQLVAKYFASEIPASVMCTPYENRGMILTGDTGREFRFEQPGINVWRSAFDAFLVGKAQNAGAELRDSLMLLNVESHQEFVQASLCSHGITEPLQARYLLDCTGVTGSWRRKVTGCASDTVTTFQTFYHGSIDLDPHYFYAYLQPELSAYDAWFNVKDDFLVLGVASANPAEIPLYYRRFLEYMQTNHGLKLHGAPLKQDRWQMPKIVPGCPVTYGSDRVLFAGEAAGFLNPMGEGISAAMESGAAAAQAIADNFHNPQAVLRGYRDNVQDLHAYMRRQWRLLSGMSESFSGFCPQNVQ